ncbi:MAG: CheA signal transduction histidine kinase [Chlamydiales bacterium]|jgi:two-component system chemotaxis sensor kinase CheA|nr:CheA signal transduction histidine kinase [Chlamydiales bacterium]
MSLRKSAFINKYLEELRENIQAIDTCSITLKKDSENEEALVTLLRALHTVKGSSRMLKFSRIEHIAHGLENVFKGVKDKRFEFSNNLVQLVFISTDFLKYGADLIQETQDDNFEIEALLEQIKKAESNEPYDLKAIKVPSKSSKSGANINKSETNQQVAVVEEAPVTSGNYETIRVKINDIDKIIRSLNNLIIKQFQLKKEYEHINELENKINEFLLLRNDLDSGNSIAGRDTGTAKQKAEILFKDIQKIKKNFLERITLIETNTFELQEGIIALRMLPLDLILGSLDKMVEENAIAMGKEIDLVVSGREVKLDKVILEKINDPIIHLVRNSIDHGIEKPTDREKKGKARAGKIEIKCYSENQHIVVEITDDGQGINYDGIRKKAIENRLAEEDDIKRMTETELQNFIFMAGFSTKQEVSTMSGRGIGMNIVKHNIDRIKGKISITSEKDKGTSMKLALPLSLATVEGFFVTSGSKKFLIPSNFVREIIILKKEEKISLLNSEVLKLRDKIIPLYKLSAALNLDCVVDEEMNFVVIVEANGEIVGMIVESVIEHSSLIFKPLPKNMHKLNLIQGIVFDESFNIINILYIAGIIEKFKSFSNIDTRKRFVKDNKKYKSVLIVDDSSNTREIIKSILEGEEYNLTLAVDGVDGLAKAREKTFHLIISDINMPRMDGFTLIENLRREEKYKSTPILVISSLENDEHRKRLDGLGVSGVIVKGEFDRAQLTNLVQKLIG